MTNHWCDIGNANAIMIIGSNAAEHHPISFKWVLKARDKGAVVMHIDPKFSRTSAHSDLHVPLRSGTDIPFMGGMINYILENEKYFKDYVVNYTNASFIVGKSYQFNDGLFSGYDAEKKAYDKKAWSFEKDKSGLHLKDETLKDERCVFQLMKKHYSRYNLKDVSEITGVSEKDLIKVYEAYAATGKPHQAGTIMYALGWTQHTVGVQNIRSSAIVQLLLGNIGVAGGGINALRGEPNVQGSTDHAILYHILPGYLPVPQGNWANLDNYTKATTPVSADPVSANWWQNRPKYMVSLLKAWFGEKATRENGFGYQWLPKVDVNEDYSYIFLFDRMFKNQIRGGFVFGTNPAMSAPNSNKVRSAMDTLDWLIVGEIHHTETSENWHRPDVDPKKIKTEVFLLPSCQRAEKEGSISNSGRWHLWHYKAVEPMGESRSMGDMYVSIFNKVQELYKKKGGTFPEPILNMNYPEKYDALEVAKRINGFFEQDTTIKDKSYKKGQLVPGFPSLQDDGSTSSLCWVSCGSYTEEDGLKAMRRDLSQTPMQKKIALFPNFAWCWPMNRRILYNRASVDLNGMPYAPDKAVIKWNGTAWEGDIPDGPWPPEASGKGRHAFIMTTEGYGQLFGPGRVEGPFPEHYEPAETPVAHHPFSKQMHNPCMKIATSEADRLASNADPRFPIVLTTYSMTEHWCGGGDTRNTPLLLEAEPQLYVEMSHELAKLKGIKNGDKVKVESMRGCVEAVAMVTIRIRPFLIQGKTVHLVGMPFCFGWTTPGCGDSTNRLTPSVGDPNTTIPEYKASLVNVTRIETSRELA